MGGSAADQYEMVMDFLGGNKKGFIDFGVRKKWRNYIFGSKPSFLLPAEKQRTFSLIFIKVI